MVKPQRLLLFAAVLWVICGSAARAETAPPLSVIIDRVVKRAEAEQTRLRTMQYNQLASIDELDDAGNVVRHQEKKSIVRPGADQPVQDVSVKGDSLSTDAARKSRRVGVHENVDQGRQQFSLARMVDRFNVTYKGEVNLNGHLAYLLGFEPKADQPSGSMMEHVLDQLHGQLWINPDDYAILQTDAHLVGPVTVGYFLADIKQLDFHYNFEGKGPQDLGPADIAITLLVDVPVIPTIHQRQVLHLTDFRPRQ